MPETVPQGETISAEDRTLAMLTHLSGLAGYIIPLGGVLVPVVIWFTKNDNRTISGIARQAVLLNLAVFLCVIVFIVLALTVILIPLSILGIAALSLAAVVLPIVGAVRALDGRYYRYPLIGSGP